VGSGKNLFDKKRRKKKKKRGTHPKRVQGVWPSMGEQLLGMAHEEGCRGRWDVGGKVAGPQTCDRCDRDKVTMEEGTRDMAELEWE
jgi:hypothetical protein